MSILNKLSRREVMTRPGRAVLTLLSVVIGVAAVVAVSIATATTRRNYQQMYRAVTGDAALEVSSVSGLRFDARLADEIQKLDGVRVVSPVVQRLTIMYFQDRRVQLTALGVDPQRDAIVRNYEIVQGKFFDDGKGIILDANFAAALGLKLNDEVKIATTRSGIVTERIVGLSRPKGAGALSQGGMLLMTLSAAQRRFNAPDQVDRIYVVLAESADAQQVQNDIAALLPEGIRVQPPATSSQVATETILALEQGLGLAIWFSLLAAVFIILNAFLMNVTQRRRQMAIMRAVGATRWQVGKMVFREALLLGAAGTVLGMLVGLGAAYFLTRSMEQLLNTQLPALTITPLPFLLAIAFGMGISLVGSLLPAWRASRLSPLEAMRGVTTGATDGVSRWIPLAGVGVLLATASVFFACFSGWLPIDWSVPAAVGGLIGCVLLLPIFCNPLSRFLVNLLPRKLRVEARLAQRQLARQRVRTALTAGVLFVAASTGLGLANSVIDNVHDVRDWYRRAIVGDFFVRAMMPDMASGDAADVPEEVGEQLRQIPGIRRADPIRFVQATADNESVIVVARDFPTDDDVNFDVEGISTHELREDLLRGEVVIGSVLGQRTGLKAGDSITLETIHGPRQLPIAATVNEYMAGGLALHMYSKTAAELLGLHGVDAYVIKAQPGKLPQVKAALSELCQRNGLLLQSFDDLVGLIDTMMAGVVGGLWVLLALGLVVASLGVINTLTMNVLEQTREIGLLRVVAMTRKQVRRCVISQAALLGLIALPPGIVAGIGFAYLMNLSTMTVVGHSVAFHLHPFLLFGGLIAAQLIVVAAAWFPARRATRLDLLTALHYE